MSDSDIVNRLRDVTDIDYASTQTIKEAARKIESLEAELAAMRQRVEWRPIETAPKDATEFLGYWDNEEVHVVCIRDGECVRDMDESNWMMPVLWMPLPPAPKETGE